MSGDDRITSKRVLRRCFQLEILRRRCSIRSSNEKRTGSLILISTRRANVGFGHLGAHWGKLVRFKVQSLLRHAFTVLLLAAVPALATPAESGQLDASPSLFTVMAAINAAGYRAEWSSPNNHPIRMAVQAELAKRDIPSLGPLKEFFESHRKKNDALELSQYISFALSCNGPPAFEFITRDVEVPPDAMLLRDLSRLLAAFYKEGNIEDLWKRSQPAIEQYIARYHEPVTDAVLQVNGYMRQMTSGFKRVLFR